MELKMRNITVFSEKTLVVPGKTTLIVERSARGKTTVARVLYAFLTGRVDSDLLSQGKEEGVAELTLGNSTYVLKITKNRHEVFKIFEAEYADYLVLTEGTPLYGIYLAPDKMNLQFLVSKFVPPPDELRAIQADLYRLEKSVTNYDKIIQEYVDTVKHYQRMKEEIERKLEEIEEKLKKWKEYEKVKVIIKKREKEGELKNIDKLIKEYNEEIRNLATAIQGVNYDEIKNRRKEIADELGRLHMRKRLYEEAEKGFRTIKEGLKELEKVVDVILELNTPLFGQLPGPDSIRIFINDCDSSIDTIVTKKAEITQKISELEEELSNLDNEIRNYVAAHEKISRLTAEITKLEKKRKEVVHELARLQRTVNALKKETNKTEEELLKTYFDTEDLNKLMSEKNRLLREKEKCESYIKSFQDAIAKTMKDKEEAQKAEKIYEELKKKESALKNAWQKKRKTFTEEFMKAFTEAFKNISIPDFSPEEMRIYRPPHTYSNTERLYITIAYQYALVWALHKIGCEIPLVVVDLIVPMDSKYEGEVLRLMKKLPVRTIVLKTGDSPATITLQ